ncbi:DISARM system helicase DrmA [Sorangium sp. So ce341]|uniref:DISARM system helicase DrmA n=1 Tax=Sorangium sp. So ce341 TaxID=3133302 RepID=UPI003F5D6EE7
MSTAAEIRQKLVDTLALDLVGPGPGHPLENERLWESEPPSRWYLTGFLVPTEAPEAQRFDPESAEALDAVVTSEEGTGDDDVEPDAAPARKVFLSSSMGLSVLVPSGTTSLEAEVLWGDYRKTPSEDPEHPARKVWQRSQQRREVTLGLSKRALERIELPESRGVALYISARDVGELGARGDELPPGTRAVSVFVVNERNAAAEERAEEGHIFQVVLVLRLREGFVARPNLRGLDDEDADERIADLQYRDAYEFAVGHGVSTYAVVEGGTCKEVRTTWVPAAIVEKVEPTPIPGVELSMERLAELKSLDDAKHALGAFGTEYAKWIAAQRSTAPTQARRAEVARDLLARCELAQKRIQRGIEELADPLALEAFRMTNRAMARAARQRTAQIKGWRPELVPAPTWRPFQLAFLLMNLRGISCPKDPEREVLDLLFFPTGGGKTEAYLGLAAFTLALRRLRDPSITSAGVAVLMRYTLRLLTLDQLGRAATLVCALELERQKDVEKLGKWPFEIGLWVGRAATPNRMGKKGDNDRGSARARTIAFQNDSKYKPAPIPVESCPWCGTKFEATSFRLTPTSDQPTDLRITCANEDCAFTRDNPLPIVAIDEPLYRRLPCFVIATVDKIASLPWLGAPGKLFGKVDRYDAAGFYGPSDGAGGNKLPKPLAPPDLIIQDELHLISGPLGTMVGLYETAVETLCRREIEGKRVLPKIIASTATVRRAEAQVRALFGRTQVDVFPPPGPDRRDSFFAETVSADQKNPRLYVGVAAQGRSLKVVLLRTYLALLSAAKMHYDAEGGAANATNPVDSYMTLLGYFNALRELGGSRRIVEDEVRSRLQGYSRHRRVGEADSLFVDRTIQFEAIELTSREPTNRVAQAKRRLALPFAEDGRVDVALATNMISVGLDITRLGLMVVLGQPKTSAEYIQATSRVGRDEERPGLVVTLLNVHKPRDRSHYERFNAYHATFYRAVEATSVTPFAPRAVDRGLAALVVSLARHGEAALTPAARAADLAQYRARLGWVKSTVRKRAENHAKDLDPLERQEIGSKMADRVDDLLDAWEQIAAEKTAVQAGLQYGPIEARPRPPLLHDPLDPDLKREPPYSKLRKFRAQWSLRDVEAEVPVIVRRLDGGAPEAS